MSPSINLSLNTLYLAGGLWCLYGILVIVYRLFLHPLSHFPGPKIAAATKWYEFFYDIIKGEGGQYAWEMDKMHEKYGPIIRITPDEIHIKDPDFYPVIYAPAPARRDKYASAAEMVGCPLGTFGTIPHDIYRKRRAANSVFFSKRAIDIAQELINKQVDILCNNIHYQYSQNEARDMHTVFIAFTTDSLCNFVFGKSFGYQSDRKKNQEWRNTMGAVPHNTPVIKQIPWAIGLALKLPESLVRLVFPDLSRLVGLHRHMHREAAAFLENEAKQLSSGGVSNSKKRDLPPTIFHAIYESQLPEQEKSFERLAQEGFVLMAAGSDTTSRALTYGLYHLVINPHILKRLREDLLTVMPELKSKPTVQVLEGLPYFTAVIKETLRTMNLITSRLPLISPSEMQYQNWVIPAKTPVSMTINDVLTDPSIFPSPSEFFPDRWLDSKGKLVRSDLNPYFVAFGKGPRMCQGVDFAMSELYLAFAALIRRFEFELYDTVYERDVKITRDCFFGEPTKASKSIRMKVKSEYTT